MKKTIALAALLAATAFSPALAQRAPSAEGVDEAAERGRYDGRREQRQEQFRQQMPQVQQSPRAVEMPASQVAAAPTWNGPRADGNGGWQGRRADGNGGWQGRRADDNGGWQGRRAQAQVQAPAQAPAQVAIPQTAAPAAQVAQARERGNWQQNGVRNDSWRGNRNGQGGGFQQPGASGIVTPRDDQWRNNQARNNGVRNDGVRNDGFRNDGFRNDGFRNNGFRNNGRTFERRYADPRFNGQLQQRFGGNQGFNGGWNQNFNGNWNRDWRRDRQFDWQGYRSFNRNLFRGQRYAVPFGWNYGYRRFGIGLTLNNLLFGQQYWIDDPFAYRLPPAYGPYRWVQYYNDVLLVDLRSGLVVDAIYDFFW